ncbi:MAG: ABC transporter substrate-binding protein [Acholeplasmataceae bacterium]
MRKKISFILIALLLSFGLFACKDDDVVSQKISLTYADWGDQEFNQKMIDAFMEKYPDIEVSLRTDISGSGATFTGNLIDAAQVGILPDVFATDNVPTIVNAGLTYDVSDIWDADVDTPYVYDDIASTAVYNGHRFAVPSFQFLKGILINLDIFEEANLSTTDSYRIDNDGYPVKDWTPEEMIAIAKAIKNYTPDDPANLVIGMDTWYGSADFQQVWPMENDADVLYDTWNGSSFNYLSDDWIYAMEQKVALQQLTDGTITNYTTEDLAEYAELSTYLIQTGYGAMDIEGSWQFWVINSALEESNIHLGFWPYPSGEAGLFPPTILDYQAISAQTKHPEEAFLLAKWMTFGQDGWDARLTILEEQRAEEIAAGELPTYLDRFPIADYPAIWERVDALVDGIEGIEYTFDRIEYAKPDLDKWLPGYKDFWAWVSDTENNPYNWTNLVTAGPNAVPTYAQEWNDKVNEIVQAALLALGAD